jgi:hypothetical protein
MADDSIEAKALALVNEVRKERRLGCYFSVSRETSPTDEALCRAIEQHEAFKQEVSDVVYRSLMSIAKNCVADAAGDLSRFIISKPKPDPLVEIMEVLNGEWTPDEYAKAIRAALGKLGFEIREKGQ